MGLDDEARMVRMRLVDRSVARDGRFAPSRTHAVEFGIPI
jgi:hypothetical protein